MKLIHIAHYDINPTEVDTLQILAKKAYVEVVVYGQPKSTLGKCELFERAGLVFNHITTIDHRKPDKLADILVRYIEKTDPDVIVPTEFYPKHSQLINQKYPQKTYCYTWQNLDCLYHPIVISFMISRCYICRQIDFKTPALSRQLIRPKKSTRIIVPVKSTAMVWKKYLPEENINIIPFGLDLDKNRCKPPIFDDQLRILVASRFNDEKGLQYLIQALKEARYDYELRAIGNGNPEKYRKMARKFGVKADFRSYTFNYISDPTEFYKNFEWCNVFVQPSITVPWWKEQFGYSLLNAIARGRVIIGTNSGAIPDVIGEGGLIVRERNASAIAKALQEIYEDTELAQNLSRRAFMQSLNFDAKKCAESFYNLFSSGHSSLNPVPNISCEVSAKLLC